MSLTLTFFAETKMDENRLWKLQHFFGKQWSIRAIPAIGFTGGIALFWRHDRLYVKTFWWSRQALYIITSESSYLLLAVIYASTSGSVRKDLWGELHHAANLGLAFCLGGDFNVISSLTEKWGGIPFRFDWRANHFVNF